MKNSGLSKYEPEPGAPWYHGSAPPEFSGVAANSTGSRVPNGGAPPVVADVTLVVGPGPFVEPTPAVKFADATQEPGDRSTPGDESVPGDQSDPGDNSLPGDESPITT